ncbi:Hypothetical_protein [Hexamita inflata]|uniref:Hypothetical_protein n=1 Tax=Hexamita inflata TaxID=28002 RepID=A0AA86QT52_9EUKA|nr:Hypothetical protein HINF_LOCUS51208 [Hexamita inflata]
MLAENIYTKQYQPEITVIKCQEYKDSEMYHCSDINLNTLRQVIQNDVQLIVSYSPMFYKVPFYKLIFDLKKANISLQFSDINIPYQISRFRQNRITFDQLQNIIPNHFLPQNEIISSLLNQQQRQSFIWSKRQKRTNNYKNLQFIQVKDVAPVTPEISEQTKLRDSVSDKNQ